MLPRGCSANKITPARWLAAAAATAGDARRMPLLLEPAARPVQVSEFTKTVKNSARETSVAKSRQDAN